MQEKLSQESVQILSMSNPASAKRCFIPSSVQRLQSTGFWWTRIRKGIVLIKRPPASVSHGRFEPRDRATADVQYLIGDDQIELPIEPVVTNIEIRVIGPHIFAKPECPPGEFAPPGDISRTERSRSSAATSSNNTEYIAARAHWRVDETDDPPYQIIRVRERIFNLRDERRCLQTFIR